MLVTSLLTGYEGGIQLLDWTGLDWNGGLDQIIVFAHAQMFKRECTFAPALQSTMIIGQHALNDAAMNNVA